MVFFTIIIVTKYFLGVEECPLFDDGVANGTMQFSDYVNDESNFNSLRDDYLGPANAFKLFTNTPIGPYQEGNATEGIEGHVVGDCSNKYQLPEGYYNLKEQVCDASMFTFNEKVTKDFFKLKFSQCPVIFYVR